MDDSPNRRRKLLRGSLAAPVVLTVASPSALAATSFGRCVANAARQPQPPADAIVKNADSWYRTTIKIYKGKLRNTNTFAEFYLQNGLYYPLNSCTTGYMTTDFIGQGPKSEGNRLALVFVDSNGNQVGFGPCPNGGTAVPLSCWTSLHPR